MFLRNDVLFLDNGVKEVKSVEGGVLVNIGFNFQGDFLVIGFLSKLFLLTFYLLINFTLIIVMTEKLSDCIPISPFFNSRSK